MAKILFVREYQKELVFDILHNYEILEAKKFTEVKAIVDEQKDSIDGYVIGMILLREDAELSKLEEYQRTKDRLTRQLPSGWRKVLVNHGPGAKAIEDMQYRLRGISSRIDMLHNYQGGEEVIKYLAEVGEVGKKPILYYTIMITNPVVKDNAEQQIEVANYPEYVRNWFRKHFAAAPVEQAPPGDNPAL